MKKISDFLSLCCPVLGDIPQIGTRIELHHCLSWQAQPSGARMHLKLFTNRRFEEYSRIASSKVCIEIEKENGKAIIICYIESLLY